MAVRLVPLSRIIVLLLLLATLNVARAQTSIQPSRVNFSYLTGQRIFGSQTRTSFPATFDLRLLGKVTPVRDQSPFNTCWSFAAIASVETTLQPGESRDFSEMNMARTHGFALKVNEGGSHLMALAYLARWSGPVNETDDPYTSVSSPAGAVAQKHVQDAMVIPNRSHPLDNGNIKQALMDYGGVSSTIYWTASAFNFSTSALYYAGTVGANHSVTIVGWDDTYSRTRFPSPPPGDGAFIVRNSYGSGWGEKGYFYVSYYDTNIGKSNMLFYNAESPTNYQRNYQYDLYGLTGHAGYGKTTAWFANVFTAKADESLAAAALYTAVPNSSYELLVYTNPTNGPITSGTPATRQLGTIVTPGYHTVKLTTPALLSVGQRFSVVVKLTTPGYLTPIPLEQQLGGYTPNATAAPGQSYMSADGSAWSDVTSRYPNSNVCVKAFTRARTVTASTRPDLSVRTATTTAYTGEGILNQTGSGQTAAQGTRAGVPVVYYLKMRNTGETSGTFAVSGPAGTGGWTVRYFNAASGGSEVTTSVTASGGWRLPLDARAEKILRAEVVPPAFAIAGAVNEVYVRVTASLADVVKLQTSVQTGTSLSSLRLAASPALSQVAGQPVVLTATAGGGQSVQYAFQYILNGVRSTLRGYALTSSYTWRPTTRGSYTLIVWAREAGSQRGYDLAASIPYTVR